MKKFFSDVIAEIREPSEDAGKVLDVIRRVVRVALLLSAIGFSLSFISGGVNMLMMHYQGYLAMYIEHGQESLLQFLFPMVKAFLKAIIYFILFSLSNKCIKKGTKNKVILNVMFALIIVLQLMGFNFELSRIVSSILGLINSIAYCAIIYFAFKGSVKTEDSEFNEDKLAIRNIAVLGYVIIIIYIIRQIRIPILIFSYVGSLFTRIEYVGIYIWEWISAVSWVLQGIVFVSIIAILVFSLVGRKRTLTRIREKTNLLIVLFFISLAAYLIGSLTLFSDFLYIIVFALAVSYQNKYKVFDYTHKRIFAKIKTGVDNYMHIGRD